MEVVATAKDVRITSRKARVVSRSVVGLPVGEALTLLTFTPRHAARELAKVIKSAAANAEHNYNLDLASLRIARIDVEQAGIMKRYIAKPRGMAGSLFKRMSHLRCYVTDEEPAPSARRRSLVAMPRTAAPGTGGRPAPTRRRRPARPATETPPEATVSETPAPSPEPVKAPARRRRSPAGARAEQAKPATASADAGNAAGVADAGPATESGPEDEEQ